MDSATPLHLIRGSEVLVPPTSDKFNDSKFTLTSMTNTITSPDARLQVTGRSSQIVQSADIKPEDKKWNRLSEKMSVFHEYFKEEFNSLYELADGSFTRRGLSLLRYLETAKAMNDHLTMHHTIEERYLFPVLARTMPQFAKNDDDGTHTTAHRGIHEGLVRLERLVQRWKEDPSAYSPAEMRVCLDSFRDVLFEHLDKEVADLRGENLKNYITLDELESMLI